MLYYYYYYYYYLLSFDSFYIYIFKKMKHYYLYFFCDDFRFIKYYVSIYDLCNIVLAFYKYLLCADIKHLCF